MSSNLDALYRQVIMDHYKHPRNRGTLGGEVVSVEMNNPTCGDTILIQMAVEDGLIKDIKFEGEGCSISLASASMMTQAIKGQTIEQALKMSQVFSNMVMGKEIDHEEVDLGDIEALQGVTKFPARIRCATISWEAMEKAAKA